MSGSAWWALSGSWVSVVFSEQRGREQPLGSFLLRHRIDWLCPQTLPLFPRGICFPSSLVSAFLFHYHQHMGIICPFTTLFAFWWSRLSSHILLFVWSQIYEHPNICWCFMSHISAFLCNWYWKALITWQVFRWPAGGQDTRSTGWNII